MYVCLRSIVQMVIAQGFRIIMEAKASLETEFFFTN